MAVTVAVCGALGRMGKEVIKAVAAAPDLQVAGAVDKAVEAKIDAGEAAGIGRIGVPVVSRLESLAGTIPQVMVDFTEPAAVKSNVLRALDMGMNAVVGTTGMSQGDLNELNAAAVAVRRGVVVAPNFAVGAVLMMHFAAQAAKYFPNVEIIELHHEKKKDAPSGTAIKTAEMISAVRRAEMEPNWAGGTESVPGARGGSLDGIRLHSVRLPGFVAHQEVIFGLPGQVLTLRHDSTSRESFMPGVLMAIREVTRIEGLVYGLEKLMSL